MFIEDTLVIYSYIPVVSTAAVLSAGGMTSGECSTESVSRRRKKLLVRRKKSLEIT